MSRYRDTLPASLHTLHTSRLQNVCRKGLVEQKAFVALVAALASLAVVWQHAFALEWYKQAGGSHALHDLLS